MPCTRNWEENPMSKLQPEQQRRSIRRIRQFEIGAEVPTPAKFLGMHIEMRNDGLRTTPTPVFFYEVTEPA